jgi:hypothetical protein
MKTVKLLALFSGYICVACSFVATRVNGQINGTLKAQYGSALATQVLATTGEAEPVNAGGVKANLGLLDAANGSELDAAYGFVSNAVLYLFFAGNLDTSSTGAVAGVAYDKLHVFIQTVPGTGDNPLGTNYSGNADFGHINRMGVGGDGASGEAGSSGLTFDSGFAPNWDVEVTAGAITNITSYANLWQICSGCPGYYLGYANPSNTITDTQSGLNTGIQVALNNSNTNGVAGDANGCNNGADGGGNPLSVTTGIEMAIPLSAIGSPLTSQNGGMICVTAFIADNDCDALVNQVLGPVLNMDGIANANCPDNCTLIPPGGAYQFSCDGDSSEVNFQTVSSPRSQHYFCVPEPPCSAVQATPTSLTFASTGGVGQVTVSLDGGCGYTTAVSTSAVTIISGGSGSGSGDTLTFSISTNNTVYPVTAELYVIGTSIPVTTTVTIVENNKSLPPLSALYGNGTLNPAYGCPLAVQQIGTSWGPNNSGGSISNDTSGSELDAAYGLIYNQVLYLFLAGDLQLNNNELHIFLMTAPPSVTGAPNTLHSMQVTNIGNNILNNMTCTNGVPGCGLTFDTGFNPNYWFGINIGNPYHFYVDFAQLWPGGTNASGQCTNGYFVGQSTTAANGTLVPGASGNPFHVQATINEANTNGISGSGCVTNNNPNSPCYNSLEAPCAATVSNGMEIAIPLGQIGSPTGQVAVLAFIGNNNASWMSNQILPPANPIAAGTNYCAYDVSLAAGTGMTNINFANFGGSPHYFWVGPEMKIMSVARDTSTNININCLTENNTNLLYQLQRSFSPSNGNVNAANWKPVGGYQLGTGGIITFTDTKGGTNKPAAFYRVLQVPNCEAP